MTLCGPVMMRMWDRVPPRELPLNLPLMPLEAVKKSNFRHGGLCFDRFFLKAGHRLSWVLGVSGHDFQFLFFLWNPFWGPNREEDTRLAGRLRWQPVRPGVAAATRGESIVECCKSNMPTGLPTQP